MKKLNLTKKEYKLLMLLVDKMQNYMINKNKNVDNEPEYWTLISIKNKLENDND